MYNPSKKLNVTAVQHGGSGVITAFVTEMPGLVVQGTSEKDVANKLDALLSAFIKKLEASRKNLVINPQTLA
jgi:hypothetical protein